MLSEIKKIIVEEEAQGMVEYILIVALIAIVAVVAVKMFGAKIKSWFEQSAQQLDKDLQHIN